MSCAEVQFPEFVVEDCTFTSDSVEITFSNEPNQYLFINSFSIKEKNQVINLILLFTSCNYWADNIWISVCPSTSI